MFWTNFAIDILVAAFLVICPLMILVIMMQRSKQEGLGAAFGGGFTDSVWGAQTSQVLVKTTVWLAASFFIISILLARLYSHREILQENSSIQKELLAPVVAPASAKPATPTASAASKAPSATLPAPAAPAAHATPPVPATPAPAAGPATNAAIPAPAAPATPPAK